MLNVRALSVAILLAAIAHYVINNDSYQDFTKLTSSSENYQMSAFYSFAVKDLYGKPFDLNQLKGKVVLVVNVASQCGFTKQYSGLQELYDKYKDKGFTILGFPCNQFGGQEPGDAEEIHTFCSRNFGVKFPILEKVEVNGDNVPPVWEWLKNQKSQLLMSRVKWNFEKFLVDKDGNLVDRYASTTTPESLQSAIEKLLQ